MDRAYSTFEIKSIDEDKRIITGIASTPSVDRMDDIVEPLGAVIKLPTPLLWMHDACQPVGQVIAAKPTKDGIPVTCQFTSVDEPASLKDDLDRAWAMVKSRLVRGFSIGFIPIEYAQIDGSWGRRYTKWELTELSCVTVPANSDCSIQTIKSLAQAQRRTASGAHGAHRVVRLDPLPANAGNKSPGVSGTTGARRPGVVYLNP